MGPKRTTASASKKQRTAASSSRSQGLGPFDPTRFIGPRQQQRHTELLERKFWSEKEFIISENGTYRGIASMISSRKWEVLVRPPTHLNYDIIREFYANSIPSDPDVEFPYQTMVRGRAIRFDRDAINAYLGNPIDLPHDALCAFHQRQNRGNWNHAEIAEAIFLPGKSYELNPSNQPFRAHRHHMNTPAQVILNLILHNIRPRSHTSTTTLDVTPLLYYILSNQQVDIARVISQEMKIVAESGIKPPAKKKCPLVFPSLIMGLCHAARIVIPAQVHETIKNPINDEYIDRHCKSKRAPRDRTPPQAPPAPPAPPTSLDPQFADWDPRYLSAYSYTWDQNESNHRALSTVHDSMYRLQLQMGVPQDPAQQIMAPAAYQTHVAWPGVRPFYLEEDGAHSGARNAGDGGDEDVLATNSEDGSEESTEDDNDVLQSD